jgi:hypothetical protein
MSPIPPDETPSSNGSSKGFGWVPVIIGIAVGLAVGVGAHSLGGSPWLWFLAPVLGLVVALFTRRRP